MPTTGVLRLIGGALALLALGTDAAAAGKDVYEVKCAACHRTGLLGAPKPDAPADWTARLAQPRETLLEHALNGFKAMPPRGGNPGLSDADVRAAVEHMLAQVEGGGAPPSAPAAAPTQTAAAPAPAPAAAPAAAPAPTPAPKAAPAPRRQTAGANSFNRLLKPPSKRNPPPMEDGIHDPTNPGTEILQAPREAFAALPQGTGGNRVDWVEALASGKIAPRYELFDSGKQPVIMDLNIVREVKGSMPDVVYPHKQHTEWLDCSNCHPAIFVPQKGANQISMAGILLGKQCGVCHGKVAFPVSDCRRCHSNKKQTTASR
ncbi:MAG: c-type cytochrome [Ectothiorhodospiraceae bacterium]|nr:c-type cytochrome [Chromatiales bacterium]MCP5154596.1 c-type cytochrome [Ectothiorhodospiraceae bacterium]